MWTEDVELAAGALELAARDLRRAAADAETYGADTPAGLGSAAMLVEQAEGELERGIRFMERARQEVARAA